MLKLRDCKSIDLKAVDKELDKELAGLVQRASTTKAEGCLLYNILNEKERLRETIQAEMKAFRGVVGKEAEKDLLLPLLLEKVQLVLKGATS